MKEVLSSSETSVLTRATRWNIPEEAILHSHRRENLKSYKTLLSPNFVSFGGKMMEALSGKIYRNSCLILVTMT
jgi:hypothetical protein